MTKVGGLNWKVNDCLFEITPSTKKYAAVWVVTRGERQKDGVANTTLIAKKAAREAAKKLGCRLRKQRPRKRRF